MSRFTKLELAHIGEAVDKGAEIYNMGWYCDPYRRIESKTDIGILITLRKRDGYSHEWQLDEEEAARKRLLANLRPYTPPKETR